MFNDDNADEDRTNDRWQISKNAYVETAKAAIQSIIGDGSVQSSDAEAESHTVESGASPAMQMLSELLAHPWPQGNDFGRGYNHLRQLMIYVMGDASTRKDEETNDTESSIQSSSRRCLSPAIPAASESAVVDEAFLLRLMGEAVYGESDNPGIVHFNKKRLDAIRPYLKSQPAPVSLEKCAKAIKTNHITSTEWYIYFDERSVAKTVLDAVNVKWEE